MRARRWWTAAILLTLLGGGNAYALTLDEALAIAKSRALALEDPRINRVGVQGQIAEAWSAALPQLAGEIGYQRAFKASKIFFPNPETGDYMALKMQQDNTVQADLTLNQPLLTFGRIAAGLRGAYAAQRATAHQAANTDRAVELETLRRFWSVLLAHDVVQARQLSLSISDSSLARATRMRDVGLLSDYDVLRVNVQSMNQRPPLREAENQRQLAELALKEWLGVSLDTAFRCEGDFDDFTLQIDSTGGAERILARDDLEALRDLNEMQRSIYVIYRNARWPTLGGQVKYSWTWQNDQWGIQPRNNLSAVYGGLGLSIPIWTGGYYRGRAQQQKAEWLRADLNVRKAERGARLQYESALRSYGAALESEAAARTTVDAATQARTIAETKFAQGQLTPLEMDAALLDELVARVALANAKFGRLMATAEARMAAGHAPFTR
ncbi:TolC family protein [candidate division KSB1 bacterium]|nr:TolC family protein [candidate division KSB1 bacterium]